MKKFIFILTVIFLLSISMTAFGTVFYLDYENGDDANDGSTWALAWKTLTNGATAARIAPGDIIRIAKSPAPTSIGDVTWTNLSKVVTLAAAQTANIDMCEVIWTGTGDTTVTLDSTYRKEGTKSMKLTLDATPQINILQAYHATGELDLSSYQKISFWIINSSALIANNWKVCLCSDVAGETVVDTFEIPAIISSYRLLPLTLTRVGEGNLGASIQSIALYTGSDVTGIASKYISVDNFISCTTNGLNLQSLISKNSLEQGGAEGWYGIQSIDGVTILLDNYTSTTSQSGQGYSTTGTSPDTVATYKRETIKTGIESSPSTTTQEIMDSGTLGNNIEFQGGYNISTTVQDGETFFDGLNGEGVGLELDSKDFITLNYINCSRYQYGYKFSGSENNTVTNVTNVTNMSMGIYFYCSYRNTIITLGNANNNNRGLYYSDSNCNTIINLGNANNNMNYGVHNYDSSNNIINTLSNANNNALSGVNYGLDSRNNLITLLSNSNNNVQYGVSYSTRSVNNTIRSLSTTGNGTAGVYFDAGPNYLNNALIAEETEIALDLTIFFDYHIYSTNHDRDVNKHRIYADYGFIESEATDRPGGTGIMWKLAITLFRRDSFYPLKLSIAKIAVVADKLVTVKVWMKKSHATNVGGKLVCPGGQLTGMSIADIVDTKADDTDTWEELEITFTPTEKGVVEIEAWAYYVDANANVYVEDMTITQAD